jgi:hypothetical protein
MPSCRLAFSLSFVFAAIGCSSATIDTSWRAPSGPTLTNVATLSPSSDVSLRRSSEDELAQQLSHHGVRAVPGYTVIGDQDLGDRNRIASALAAQGFDGIVTIRMVSAEQELDESPTFDGDTWATAVPETILRVEIAAYALPSKQLMWTAVSKSVDPYSARAAIGDASKLAGDRLAEAHVVAPAAPSMHG